MDLADDVKSHATIMGGLHGGALIAQVIGTYLVTGGADYGRSFIESTPLGFFFTIGADSPGEGFGALAGFFFVIWDLVMGLMGIFDFSYAWMLGYSGVAGYLLLVIRLAASFAASLFLISVGQAFFSTGLFSHPLVLAAIFGVTLTTAAIKQLLG